MPYILQTNRLAKTIGGKDLVKDVSLHVKKGEIYGFLGPNGTPVLVYGYAAKRGRLLPPLLNLYFIFGHGCHPNIKPPYLFCVCDFF